MAASSKSQGPQSFADALGDLHMAIANAKLAPDVTPPDLKFLNQIEMVVMARLKPNFGQPPPGGVQPPGAPGPAGAAPPGGPAGPPPTPPPIRGNATPGGGPIANAAIPPPDMDDVRQTIAETTGP